MPSPATAFYWVSPYSPDDARGGWKAMQFHLLRVLQQRLGTARRIAPVEVPEEFLAKWTSRLKKQLRLARRYAYYSESRLAEYAKAVQAQLPADDLNPVVFFGALPFVKCRPAAPFYVYTDGAFFIHYWEYNQDHSHARSEIDRICKAESEFMSRAAGVWCSSQKVADRIAKEYGIPDERVYFVGTGPGEVPPLVAPVRYENFLVMIAADFERKQGRLAVEAVADARKRGADLAIKFVGAKPPADLLNLPFVEWCGWLDLKQEGDRTRFSDIMSRAGAQILLSRSDLTPLVIPEAASYSKATMSTAVGGIPEMIRDGNTGWLIQAGAAATDIGQRIAQVFSDPHNLAQTGTAAKQFCAEQWSWEAVGEKCLAAVRRMNHCRIC